MRVREMPDQRPMYSPADGAIGGLIGGILQGMFTMLLFVLLGIGGFWQPMNLIAALFNQQWGAIQGFEMLPVLLGMMIHLMFTAMLGAIFAWGLASRVPDNVVLKAVIASLVVWVVADYLVLPIINPIMTRTIPDWLFAAAHVMFALGLGGYLAWRGRWAAATRPQPTTAEV